MERGEPSVGVRGVAVRGVRLPGALRGVRAGRS